jgi:hypothetical protein
MNPLFLNKEELKRKTKAFFQSKKWKNILVFFTFVVLAFIFWLMMYYQQKFEVEVSIPIQYKHVPSEIVLDDSIPKKIVLKIQDKGTALLNYFFSKNWAAIPIDLTDISPNKNSYILQNKMLNDKINEHLSTTTQLVSFYPENINIQYSPLKKKELPVALNGNIQPAPGYILIDNINIQPAIVNVYGNSQTLDKLQAIHTVPVKKSNLEKNLDISLDLQIPPGVRLSTDKVKVTVALEAYTEKSFELSIVAYNLPENLYVRFFPSSVELICQVALSKYSQLKEIDLEVGIDYNQLKQNKNTTIPLTLRKKPKMLINYRIIPERVEYLIEQNGNL